MKTENTEREISEILESVLEKHPNNLKAQKLYNEVRFERPEDEKDDVIEEDSADHFEMQKLGGEGLDSLEDEMTRIKEVSSSPEPEDKDDSSETEDDKVKPVLNLEDSGIDDPELELFYNGSHGVLKLDLAADSYAWEFIAVEGESFSDVGSDSCR